MFDDRLKVFILQLELEDNLVKRPFPKGNVTFSNKTKWEETSRNILRGEDVTFRNNTTFGTGSGPRLWFIYKTRLKVTKIESKKSKMQLKLSHKLVDGVSHHRDLASSWSRRVVTRSSLPRMLHCALLKANVIGKFKDSYSDFTLWN